MRGKIDLGEHKLANVYRAPASKSRWRRARMQKCPDETYRQLWRLVDGAVRDTFENHPEYLTDKGRRAARDSLIKRITGTLHGYATQVARGRSEKAQGPSAGTAADRTVSPIGGSSLWARLVRVVPWARIANMRACGGAVGSRPKFDGGA